MEIQAGACLDFSQQSGGMAALGGFVPFCMYFIPALVFAYVYGTRLKTDKEVTEAIQPDISGSGNGFSLCCTVDLGIWTKPEEYFSTWFPTQFIYTWPSRPRSGEPRLTMTDRVTVAGIVVITDLTLYLVCAYGLSKFGYDSQFIDDDALTSAASGNADKQFNVTAGNTSMSNSTLPGGDTGLVADDAADAAVAEARGRMGFLTACVITSIICVIEDIVQWIIMRVFVIVQKAKCVAGAAVGIVTLLIVELYCAVCFAFFMVVACEMTCEGLAANLMMPYLMGFPIGCTLIFAGPWGYVFHNSFGSGMTIEEAREASDGTKMESMETE